MHSTEPPTPIPQGTRNQGGLVLSHFADPFSLELSARGRSDLVFISESGQIIRTGLVSVTFRQESPETLIDWTVEAGLEAIEWGGDIHVPAGNLDTAYKIGRLTRNRGLTVPTYGSYYRVGLDARAEKTQSKPNPDFAKVLATALALRAGTIRVWANVMASKAADDQAWERTIADLIRIRDMAADEGISISLEYHNNTLNDCPEATTRLLTAADGIFPVHTFWQPLDDLAPEAKLATLHAALPWLSHVHVFADQRASRLMKDTSELWHDYLPVIISAPVFAEQKGGSHPVDRCLMIEFVQDAQRESLMLDAATLEGWLEKLTI